MARKPQAAAPQAASIFDMAPTVATKPAKGKKSDKQEIPIDGLAEHCGYDAIIKTVKTLAETTKDHIVDQIDEHFVTRGLIEHKRPENFRGVEGTASASCEARKRTALSALDDTQVSILERHGVPFDVVSDQVETFIFNPDYLTDAKVMGKASAALLAAGLPADIIQKQVGAKKRVISDASVDKLFQLDEPGLRECFRIVMTPAVKPSADVDIFKAIASVVTALTADAEEARTVLAQALNALVGDKAKRAPEGTK